MIQKLAYKQKAFDTVFVGNLKTLYSRFLLSLVKFKKLCTFDDGVGHLYKSNYFFAKNERFICKLLKSKLSRKIKLIIKIMFFFYYLFDLIRKFHKFS